MSESWKAEVRWKLLSWEGPDSEMQLCVGRFQPTQEEKWEERSESCWLIDCTVGSIRELFRPLLCPFSFRLAAMDPSLAASRKGFKGLEKHVVQDQMFGFSEVCSSFTLVCDPESWRI